MTHAQHVPIAEVVQQPDHDHQVHRSNREQQAAHRLWIHACRGRRLSLTGRSVEHQETLRLSPAAKQEIGDSRQQERHAQGLGVFLLNQNHRPEWRWPIRSLPQDSPRHALNQPESARDSGIDAACTGERGNPV